MKVPYGIVSGTSALERLPNALITTARSVAAIISDVLRKPLKGLLYVKEAEFFFERL